MSLFFLRFIALFKIVLENHDIFLASSLFTTTLKNTQVCISTLMPIYSLLFALLLITANISSAQTIKVACSDSVPPFVLPSSDQGIALDILRAALQHKNIKITPVYGSNERNLARFISREADAILVAPRDALTNAFESDQALMVFHNYAISLEKNAIHAETIADLNGFSLGAFSLATRILPPAFRQVANQSPDYREFTDQRQQVLALLTGEVDVIVLEKMLFRYLLTQIRHQDAQLTQQSIRYHNLFQPTYYHTMFNSHVVA